MAAPDPSAFLDALLSPDNAARKGAEAQLEVVKRDNPAALVAMLQQALAQAPRAEHRALAAVLLRRTVGRDTNGKSSEGVWAGLAPAAREAVKATVLQAFVTEPVPDVLKKVCHAVAELATVAATEPGGADWPALLPAVFSLSGNADPARREAGLFMFTTLTEFTGDVVIAPHCAQLQGILGGLLVDNAPGVAVAALKACCAMICSLSDDAQRNGFQGFVPPMIKVLEATLQAASASSEESPVREVLKSLIDVVQYHPVVMRPHIEAVCHAMLVIVNHGAFEDDTRKLGLEFLLSLAEEAGGTVRKLPALIDHTLSLCLRFLADPNVEDDPGAWVGRDDSPQSWIGDDEEEESTELVSAGVDAIRRLASSVRGKLFLPCFFGATHWQRLAASAEWRERRAAVLAFSLILGGCKREMAPSMKGAVAQVLPFLDDPHQRVRHAAVRCLGQMCMEFSDPNEASNTDSVGLMADSVMAAARSKNGGAAAAGGAAGGAAAAGGAGARAARSADRTSYRSIQDEAMDVLLPALVTATTDRNAPRVRGLAAAAISILFDPEYCTADHITSEAQGATLTALFSLAAQLPEAFLHSKTNALDAMEKAAMCLEEKFIPFFPQIVPHLKAMLAVEAKTDEQRALRLKVVNCLASMCEAVGKSTAREEAIFATQFVLHAQEAERAGGVELETDSFTEYNRALVRLAECLEADFAPFFQYALPPLIIKATLKVKTDIYMSGAADEVHEAAAGGAGAGAEMAGGPPGAGSAAGTEAVTVTIGGETRTVALDSSAMAEKEAALRCISVLIADMGVKEPVYWKVVDTQVPTGRFVKDEAGRDTAVAETHSMASALIAAVTDRFNTTRELAYESLNDLMRCAVADTEDRAHGQRMLEAMMPAVITRLSKERAPDALQVLCNELCCVMKLCYRSTVPEFNGPNEERDAWDAKQEATKAGAPLGLAPAPAPAAAAGFAGAGIAAGKYGAVRLPPSFVPALFASVTQIYIDSERRRREMVEKTERNLDLDEEDRAALEEELGQEDDIITSLTDIVGYCIKQHGEAVLPWLAIVPPPNPSQPDAERLPALGAYMLGWLDKRADVDVPMRAAAVCLLDDLIEFASPQSHVLLGHFLPVLQECVTHASPLLRQPSTYGVGVCAQHGGDAFAAAVPALFERLVAAIRTEGAREGDMHGATDNAVSALIKLAKFRPALVHAQGVMPGVLAYLPLRADSIEARLVHGWMVDGLAASDPLWCGAGNAQVPALLRALAKTLLLHKQRSSSEAEAAAAGGGGGGGGDDDEEDDEEDDDPLFEDASLRKLLAFAAHVRADAGRAGAVAGVVSAMRPAEQAVMRAVGFVA